MKDAHVTIYDVAERAGVSASTASRALAGLKVSKKNLIAVEKAAADLDYIPNEAARALRVTRTMAVGMVFNQLTSQLGMELVGSLSSALEEHGYSLFISTAQGDEARYDALVRKFLERRVDALVCVHGHGEARALQRYISAGIPAMALINRAGDFENLPLVSDAILEASKVCVTRLTELGHRRIGVVEPPAPIHLIQDVIAAVGELRAPIPYPTGADGWLDAGALLDDLSRNRPTALIAFRKDAVSLLDAAQARGIRVPEDLSIVAIRDRSELVQAMPLPLSIIHVDPTLMGRAAAASLLRWIEEKAPPADMKVEGGDWRERATTGPASKR